MDHADSLVLGFDIGGTSSRAVVHDLRGRCLGSGSAAGGNPQSHPPEQAAEEVATAASTALAEVDVGSVVAGVLGLAGASGFDEPAVSESFHRAFSELGLTCPIRVVPDVEVAFAAGTTAADGTVLVAGTGSAAARISGHRLAVTVGGYGWLLGDEGSAFWLGREAVRMTLAAIEGRRPTTELTADVLRQMVGGADACEANDPSALRRAVITAVNAGPPIRLAELAPLVTANPDDETASDILRRGAALLADTARVAHDRGPIVLSGALLAEHAVLGDLVRAELDELGVPVRVAAPGVAGAAWLAAADVLDTAIAVDRHPAFLGQLPRPTRETR